MSTKKAARKSGRSFPGFSEEERAAMKERVQELKSAERREGKADEEEAESDVLQKIAEMPAPDRALAKRLHALIKAGAPELRARLWYGMPAYALNGRVVCFFQGAQKFKTRYATFGFSDAAHLDQENLWPVAFAVKKLTVAEEATIGALVKKALS